MSLDVTRTFSKPFFLKIQFLTRNPLVRRRYRKCTFQISMYTFLENGEWFGEKIEDLGRIRRAKIRQIKPRHIYGFNQIQIKFTTNSIQQNPQISVIKMAERERFELSIRFPAYTLSRGAPSTTRPPFRFRLAERGGFEPPIRLYKRMTV